MSGTETIEDQEGQTIEDQELPQFHQTGLGVYERGAAPPAPARPPESDAWKALQSGRFGMIGQAAGMLHKYPEVLPVAGAVAGGAAGQRLAANASPFIRAGAQILGEASGLFGGLTGSQAAKGQEPDWLGNLKAAILQGGLSAAASGGAYALGRGAGVNPEATAAAIGRPEFTAKLPQRAEMDLAAELNQTAKNSPRTAGRVELDQMVSDFDSAGNRYIDGKTLLDEMKRAIPRGQSREAVNARRFMQYDMRRLQKVIAQQSQPNKFVANSGQYFPYRPNTTKPGTTGMAYPLTAAETDSIIQEHLTSAVKKELEGMAGGNLYKQSREMARNIAAQEMYKRLGLGAREAAQEAHGALRARSAMLQDYKVDKLGIPTPGAIANVARAGSDVNSSAPALIERLQEYDRSFGSKLVDKVKELGFKRQWASQDQQAANIIADTVGMRNQLVNPNRARGFIRALARVAVRSQGMTGAAARGVVSQNAPRATYDAAQRAFSNVMNLLRNSP